jgi:putative Mg2+ transporter-C (MgtC) family protein
VIVRRRFFFAHGVAMEIVWSELGVNNTDPATVVALLMRLLAAGVLSGLVGWERERGGHAAGLRTHILVGLGSALFTVAALFSGQGTDMGNVVKGVAAGVGFLGGGTILKDVERQSVEGLTTAAAIWLTAAVGLTAAAGMYLTATVTALIALFVLRPLRKIEPQAPQHPPKP